MVTSYTPCVCGSECVCIMQYNNFNSDKCDNMRTNISWNAAAAVALVAVLICCAPYVARMCRCCKWIFSLWCFCCILVIYLIGVSKLRWVSHKPFRHTCKLLGISDKGAIILVYQIDKLYVKTLFDVNCGYFAFFSLKKVTKIAERPEKMENYRKSTGSPHSSYKSQKNWVRKSKIDRLQTVF